jgi:hypothetical protein
MQADRCCAVPCADAAEKPKQNIAAVASTVFAAGIAIFIFSPKR